MLKICNFISRWMAFFVLGAALLSLLFPVVLSGINMKVINPLLGVIMFGMGLTLSFSDFKVVFQNPKNVLIGCLAQFIIMPSVAWVLVKLFNLPPDLALGVILVGCCPGGTASNVIAFLAKGDVALSVGMTACSTLLAPILTPLLVWVLAGTMVDVDTVGMLLSIVYVVILPIVIGLIIQKTLPGLTKRVVQYLPAFSSLMISFVVALIISHTAANLLAGGLIIVLVVILHNLLGLSIGYGVATLLGVKFSQKVAISIEVGMQNSGLASSLASMHFAAFPMATIAGAIFSVWHNISGALAAKLYRGLAK